MEFKTYDEFFEYITNALPGWEIVLGTKKDGIKGNTCFINQRGSSTVYADGVPLISSSSYDLIFLQKRSAFTNRQIVEILENGVDFNLYDEDSGMNVFTGEITLFGPRSVPDE